MRFALSLLLAAMTLTAFATTAFAAPAAPRHSPRPEPRNSAHLLQQATDRPFEMVPPVRKVAVPVYYRSTIRPRPRHMQTASGAVLPAQPTRVAYQVAARPGYQLATTPPVFQSQRPVSRPLGLKTGSRHLRSSEVAPVRLASLTPPEEGPVSEICHDPRLQGEVLGPIAAKRQGCGLANPVRVTDISGISLSQPAVVDCQTARAMAGWVTKSVRPAVGRRGGGLAGLQVVASYSCRTRNNVKGAKISEHGKGRAVDIAGLTLANGETITVKQGWKNRRDRRLLSKVRAQACGPFGTVLGPGSDRYHSDHLHLDTARYRSGPYCR